MNTAYENTTGKADRYGDKYWNVYLTEGRVVQLHADRVEITLTGDLAVIGSWRALSSDEESELAHSDAYTLAAYAAGTWTSFEAASVFTGDPVFIDRVVIDA